MDKLKIRGGRPLRGSVRVCGAKNAALPALAACLLTESPVTLHNLPRVHDVSTMFRVLEHLGAEAVVESGTSVTIRMRSLRELEAPYDLVRKMRASVLVLGPLVARFGRARVSLPGGCAIGERPIEMHLDALRRLGAAVELAHGYVDARAGKLAGADITFGQKTVTGTENSMMAAALAKGPTVLRNCAEEPEIVDLAELLNAMGASVEGAGTDVIRIEGVDSLHGAEHAIVPDRIEAGTFVMAGVGSGGDLTVSGCRPEHLAAPLDRLVQAGAHVQIAADSVRVVGNRGGLCGRDVVTAPYPGFATDLQAQYMTLMTQAEGPSVITEAIFENRFMHVGELRRMGADITHDGRRAVVKGPTPLTGAQVMATDLRASACLVIAALVADGWTEINRVYHIDRGYERIEEKLRSIGADIERVTS
ncbi:MAG TPA: UDP-N-acetylglucosamine 1-carboxyvinyltransferase [Verrucomicrobiae bacterium]|nr:UDP-N-acetylglucosamine 1-carboxyvinyltransferase [Verrucomicrobiae bacterium]